ncbi:50S ribosomal protein L33 [Rugosimonospora africana]|uniref:30S ribosomal protein S14 n=1 Tax=Rugosimonospora africana TaxID=556532 RepID=A0A8J3QZL0_9ACTN|nr:30S ribosomal protein S14 [Rugosimonospora africana]
MLSAPHGTRRAGYTYVTRKNRRNDPDRLVLRKFDRWCARQPRDASATRLRNRDLVDGRPRGHLRVFGLSRVRMRNMALRGELPGVRKASW